MGHPTTNRPKNQEMPPYISDLDKIGVWAKTSVTHCIEVLLIFGEITLDNLTSCDYDVTE